ncbi:hypothetical protein E4K67_17495 [Desulfosporosinus fructosivorans]|uniref:IraD/Gp25-like domain-containing protein n=1 Tax=Desulfosporosinus fructosivorans TaxID=2018669 RepID=A0A4Z0R2R2_9FIRM|nr:hypothetical protein [Desulfosporosinus fructosivorans]TGE36894.1 hypothetical protein E4K67_17495 [Desulfosporosinus fructosivorans]
MPQTIYTSQGNLDWTAKGSQRKAQNVLNLLNTWRYDVAYNRIMGLNPAMIDKPYPTIVALFTADVYRLVQDYQPDVTVTSVTVKGINEQGKIDAEVVIEV